MGLVTVTGTIFHKVRMARNGQMRAFNSLSKALSAVSPVWVRTGLKTRVLNNLVY